MNAYICYLRIFAVTIVVIYHVVGAGNAVGMSFKYWSFLYDWGRVGVDIFFVLSGYLIAMTSNGSGQVKEFYLKRMIRILPSYWILTIIIFIIPYVLGELVNSDGFDLKKLAFSLLLIDFLFDDGVPLLYVGWSLEVEMLFYLLYGLLINIKNQRYRVSLQISTGLIIAFIFNDLSAIAFTLGIASYYIKNLILKVEKKIFIIIGIVMLGASFQMTGDLREFVVAVAVSFIVLYSEKAYKVAGSMLEKISDSTYAVYLMQVFTVSLCVKLSTYYKITAGDLIVIPTVMFTFLISYFFMAKVDKRISKKIKSRLMKT